MHDSKTVFVVDDDPAVLTSVRTLLATNGFDVRSFESTKVFLDQIDIDTVGCLVTDLRMPGMDGAQLQRVLLLARSSLAVIVVTAHADVPLAVDLMHRGAVTVLEKPYNPPALVNAVRKALRQSREMHRQVRRVREIEERLAQLADQEREIMDGMIAGKPIKTVSHELEISMRTVDRRRAKVLMKMQVASIGELGALLAEYGGAPGTMNKTAAVIPGRTPADRE